MTSKYGKVAVLMGGNSGEREISLKSGAAVLAGLLENNIDAHGVDVDKNIFNVLQEGSFDRAFIALHGCGGEDGAVQGGLEMIGIPYTGSGVMASSICMDKIMTKTIWETSAILSPKFVLINEETQYEELVSQLGSPFIVKPSLEGSSLGIHKVATPHEFESAVADAKRFQGYLMAEQWIEGSEYTVAVLNNRALPVIRLKTPHSFYDFEAKYKANDTQYILPCGMEPEQEALLQAKALAAFSATGASGWGRVDVMIDAHDEAWFLEVNTVPGMTDHSLVPMAAASINVNFSQLVVEILETSFREY